ncbi:uncharacterized protein LOC143371217 [Andrena cerasifolii]|uniref:uncharacterized protein LOC143371217 n=1 Tax=Andrena cerasifolii TaxID=2819439 RepID=UPI0040378186
MVLVGDMRFIFIIARILGCASHVVTEDDVQRRRPRDVFFTVSSMAVYLCTLVLLYVYVLMHQELDTKGLFFNFMRVFLIYLCFFVDYSFTTLWNWKIRAVLSQLRAFDRATKFHDASKQRRVRAVCSAIVLLTLIYWSIVGYISCRVELIAPMLRGIMYGIIYTAVGVQILIFAGISFLIGERFRQLCVILTRTTAEGKLIVADRLNGHFTLQQIWCLHCSLVNATEMFNSVYAVQLLLWISSMSLNAMSRIYALNVYHVSGFLRARETMMAIFCSWNIVLITIVCHATASQANRVGEIIFAPSSSASMKRVFLQENLEAAAYFQLRKVHFSTVAGFIRVDLPLLLSIISAMTTYLVILC